MDFFVRDEMTGEIKPLFVREAISITEIMRNTLLCSGNITLPSYEEKLVGFVICSSKKYVELKTTHTTYKKECHKDDDFDWKIGLGLAYSLFDSSWQNRKIGIDINDYRNTIIEKEKGKVVKKYKELDYVAYSMKMLKAYLKYGDFNYNDFVTRVDEALKAKKDFYVSFKNYKNDLNKIIKKEEK